MLKVAIFVTLGSLVQSQTPGLNFIAVISNNGPGNHCKQSSSLNLAFFSVVGSGNISYHNTLKSLKTFLNVELIPENNDEDLALELFVDSLNKPDITSLFFRCYDSHLTNQKPCSISQQIGNRFTTPVLAYNIRQKFNFDVMGSRPDPAVYSQERLQRFRSKLKTELDEPNNCSGETMALLINRIRGDDDDDDDDMRTVTMVSSQPVPVKIFEGDKCASEFLNREHERKTAFICLGRMAAQTNSQNQAQTTLVNQQDVGQTQKRRVVDQTYFPSYVTQISFNLRSGFAPSTTESPSSSFLSNDLIVIPVILFAAIVIILPMVYLWRSRLRAWWHARRHRGGHGPAPVATINLNPTPVSGDQVQIEVIPTEPTVSANPPSYEQVLKDCPNRPSATNV